MTNHKKGQTPKMKHYAALRTSDGELIYKEPKNGTDFSLEELQGFVGGCIEIIPLVDDLIMVVNEEGKLLDLPFNKTATEIFWINTDNAYDHIVGNALICESCLVR